MRVVTIGAMRPRYHSCCDWYASDGRAHISAQRRDTGRRCFRLGATRTPEPAKMRSIKPCQPMTPCARPRPDEPPSFACADFETTFWPICSSFRNGASTRPMVRFFGWSTSLERVSGHARLAIEGLNTDLAGYEAEKVRVANAFWEAALPTAMAATQPRSAWRPQIE